MNISEANDLNTVLHWAMGTARPYGIGHPTDEEATEAARRLAARAYKALMAGLHAEDVTLARDFDPDETRALITTAAEAWCHTDMGDFASERQMDLARRAWELMEAEGPTHVPD